MGPFSGVPCYTTPIPPKPPLLQRQSLETHTAHTVRGPTEVLQEGLSQLEAFRAGAGQRQGLLEGQSLHKWGKAYHGLSKQLALNGRSLVTIAFYFYSFFF